MELMDAQNGTRAGITGGAGDLLSKYVSRPALYNITIE